MRSRIHCDIDPSVSCANSCERYFICPLFCVKSSISLIAACKRQMSNFGEMGGWDIGNISTSHPLFFKYNPPSVQKKGNTQLHFSLASFFPSKRCFPGFALFLSWWSFIDGREWVGNFCCTFRKSHLTVLFETSQSSLCCKIFFLSTGFVCKLVWRKLETSSSCQRCFLNMSTARGRF